MNKERVVLSSKSVELSEYKTYLLLENRVCYYGKPNANSVSLATETSEQYAQTLVDMPVYAKYVPNMNGDPSFGGHEPYLDEDGEIAFDTMPIGVHTSVNVRPDLVETAEGVYEELPCLFATQKIWTRNKNIVAAVKRLFSEGKLYNSWEISYDTCRYLAGGVKELIDYTFEGNCFLGVDNFNYPAYGPDACVISLSALQNSEAAMLVATAAAKDAAESSENNEGGENSEMDVETNVMENEALENPQQAEIETEPEAEEAEIQEENSATEEESSDEHENSEELESEEDAEAEEPDVEEKTEDEPSDDEDVDTSATLDTLCNQIAELTKKLNEARAETERLASELEKYHAAERAAQVAELKKYVQDSGCFTTEEIESEEISSLISALDKASLAEKIADRAVESMRKKNTSSKGATATASAAVAIMNDNADNKNHIKDYRVIINDFLTK